MSPLRDPASSSSTAASQLGSRRGQRPLAAAYDLVAPSRSGYPPNPPLDLIDFEQERLPPELGAGPRAAVAERMLADFFEQAP